MRAVLPRSAVLGALAVGFGAGSLLAAGRAAEAGPAAEPGAASLRVRCRLFAHTLDVAIEIDTHDTTTEIGQWVADRAADGWTLQGVDLEVGQKPTGYLQGFHEVCVGRRVPEARPG